MKELGTGSAPPGYGQLGWTTLLAEVATEDHDEHVGGTLHPRPRVAARYPWDARRPAASSWWSAVDHSVDLLGQSQLGLGESRHGGGWRSSAGRD